MGAFDDSSFDRAKRKRSAKFLHVRQVFLLLCDQEWSFRFVLGQDVILNRDSLSGNRLVGVANEFIRRGIEDQRVVVDWQWHKPGVGGGFVRILRRLLQLAWTYRKQGIGHGNPHGCLIRPIGWMIFAGK